MRSDHPFAGSGTDVIQNKQQKLKKRDVNIDAKNATNTHKNISITLKSKYEDRLEILIKFNLNLRTGHEKYLASHKMLVCDKM